MSKHFWRGVIALFLMTAVLSGCGPQDERTVLKNLFVDAVCNHTKVIHDNIDKLDMSDDAAMKNIKEENDRLNNEMEKLPQKYGFRDDDAFEEAIGKYEDDKDFEQVVLKAIKDTCGYELESLDAL